MKYKIYDRYKREFINGDVAFTNRGTSNWAKWLILDKKIVLLDSYLGSIEFNDPFAGIVSGFDQNIEFLGNVFENPELICAPYHVNKCEDNFRLYLKLVKKVEKRKKLEWLKTQDLPIKQLIRKARKEEKLFYKQYPNGVEVK